jgi:NitT/TauT family transport system substrate-binding protein
LRRLEFTLKEIIVTPYVEANGLGGVDQARLAKHIDVVTEALALPVKPSASSVFTTEFLPPANLRHIQK